jgi:hypothetical protein
VRRTHGGDGRNVQLEQPLLPVQLPAHVDELPEEERDVTVSFEFTEEGDYWFRTFRGRLIQPMPTEQARTLAGRIQAMDLDVLAVQEVDLNL